VPFLFGSCSPDGAWDVVSAPPTPKTSYRIPVTFDRIAQSTSLTNFPVLVRLEAGTFPYKLCRADGLDVRFRADDGTTALAFEREKWEAAGRSDFWVKLPSLAASPATTKIWIYFGDGDSVDESKASAVWTNGYLAVLHGNYSIDPSTLTKTFIDATGANNPALPGLYSAPADLGASSPVGNSGFIFGNTIKDGIKFPAAPALDDLGPFTFETWMRDGGSVAGSIIFNQGPDFNLSVLGAGSLRFQVGYSATALQCDSPATYFATGGWDQLALSWDGASGVAMYSNGTAVAATVTGPSGTRTSDAATDLIIGNIAAPPIQSAPKADFDEIRISNVVRSPDWIAAQHLSQLGTNLDFGPRETIAP